MPKIHSCPTCGKQFNRKSSKEKHQLFRHREKPSKSSTVPLKQIHQCPFCVGSGENPTVFKLRKDLISHVDLTHLKDLNYSLHKTAINEKIKFFRKQIFSEQTLQDFVSFKKNQKDIADVIKHELSKTPTIKVALILSAAYQIPDFTSSEESDKTVKKTVLSSDNEETNNSQLQISDKGNEKLLNQSQTLANDRDTFALRTNFIQFVVFDSTRSLNSKVKRLMQGLLKREEDLLTRGSGWRFESISFCDIQITNI